MNKALLNVDLSQAELRVMAVLSGDDWMRQALQENAGDFFDDHLMPVAFPHILYDFESVEDYKKCDPVSHKEDRTKCKAVVYGLSFGRQAQAIGKALGMPAREAQRIIDNFLASAYDLDKWRQQVMEAARVPSKRAFLTSPFGRKFQSEIVTSKNFRNIQREALSFLPQSTSSDIMLATLARINPEVKRRGAVMINVVHDAVMVEGERDVLEELGPYIGRELRKTGAAVLGDSIPFLSDWSVGTSWADLS